MILVVTVTGRGPYQMFMYFIVFCKNLLHGLKTSSRGVLLPLAASTDGKPKVVATPLWEMLDVNWCGYLA